MTLCAGGSSSSSCCGCGSSGYCTPRIRRCYTRARQLLVSSCYGDRRLASHGGSWRGWNVRTGGCCCGQARSCRRDGRRRRNRGRCHLHRCSSTSQQWACAWLWHRLLLMAMAVGLCACKGGFAGSSSSGGAGGCVGPRSSGCRWCCCRSCGLRCLGYLSWAHSCSWHGCGAGSSCRGWQGRCAWGRSPRLCAGLHNTTASGPPTMESHPWQETIQVPCYLQRVDMPAASHVDKRPVRCALAPLSCYGGGAQRLPISASPVCTHAKRQATRGVVACNQGLAHARTHACAPRTPC